MGLINCPDCNKEISDRAPACIHCGAPISDKSTNENAISDHMLCRICLEKDQKFYLSPAELTETPSGAKFVAIAFIFLGVLGFFVLNLGSIVFVLIGILILSLAKKTKKVLRCPNCGGIRPI